MMFYTCSAVRTDTPCDDAPTPTAAGFSSTDLEATVVGGAECAAAATAQRPPPTDNANAHTARSAEGGVLAQVQAVHVAGQAAVAGQESAQRLPLAPGEQRISDRHQHTERDTDP